MISALAVLCLASWLLTVWMARRAAFWRAVAEERDRAVHRAWRAMVQSHRVRSPNLTHE